MVNGEGRKMLEIIEETGWEIFNGNTEGDEEGGVHIYRRGRGERR